jgi:hypothetical protein
LELIKTGQLSSALGISYQRVHQIMQSNRGFPVPVGKKGRHLLWDKALIEMAREWMDENLEDRIEGPPIFRVLGRLRRSGKSYERDGFSYCCLEWTGPLTNGYGRITISRRKGAQAHRVVYEFVCGVPPSHNEAGDRWFWITCVETDDVAILCTLSWSPWRRTTDAAKHRGLSPTSRVGASATFTT